MVTEPGEGFCKRCCKEIVIFENTKKAKIHTDTQPEPEFPESGT
jgi:hypothetical protein